MNKSKSEIEFDKSEIDFEAQDTDGWWLRFTFEDAKFWREEDYNSESAVTRPRRKKDTK